MKFVKINNDTLRCLISEEEMTGYGIEVEELITNKEKAQDFLQMVLADAEEETGFRIEENAISVEATLLPGKGLSLTISAQTYSNSITDKLRRFHEAVKDYVRLQEETVKALDDSQGMGKNLVIYELGSLESAQRLCAEVKVENVTSSFYKIEEKRLYYLILEKNFSDDEMRMLGAVGLEFAKNLMRGEGRKTYLVEHGTCLIGDHALEILRELAG